MRGRVEDIGMVLKTIQSANDFLETLYLEKETIGAILKWIQSDPLRPTKISKPWKIVVFKHQLVSYGDYQTRRRQLSSLGFTIEDLEIKAADSIFIDEVERTYFINSGPHHRQLAEFYVLIRKVAGNGWVNVISQDRSFERIPMLNTFFVGTEIRTGGKDLPAQFDFLRDLNIHPSLIRSIGSRLDDSVRGDVVREAINTLQDHIRTTSKSSKDGIELMNEAFMPPSPKIKVNPLTDLDPKHSQMNEQKGFHQLYCGVITGLRNPIAHNMASSEFISSRFPDKITLLKYLTLVSLLCERADNPLS